MTSANAVLDLEPVTSDFRAEAMAGLSRSPKTLPCKYFYDERGSELFGKICELPEYYVTRAELAILQSERGDIVRYLGEGIELVGLGTGAGIIRSHNGAHQKREANYALPAAPGQHSHCHGHLRQNDPQQKRAPGKTFHRLKTFPSMAALPT